MKFLKLTIHTGDRLFEYFYQMKWVEDTFSKGNEFVCEESELAIVQFFAKNRSNGLENDLQLCYSGDTFSLTIDDEHPEFESEFVSVDIVDIDFRR